MSWKIGLYIDSTIAEMSAVNGVGPTAAVRHKLWYLPRQSLADGIKEFLNDDELKSAPLQLGAGFIPSIIQKRAGDAPALLVTLGFENWPFLRQPIASPYLTVEPKRTPPLLTHDLVFGVSERTDQKGNILKPLDESEIEFLISKLQFSGVKNVAVCFLHSQKNATHERRVAELLTTAGFNVVCSHTAPHTTNEVARWWRTFIGTYAHPSFTEQLNTANSAIESFGAKFEVTTQGEDVLQRYFDRENALLQLRESQNQSIFYAGYDNWMLISDQGINPIYEFDFGPVYLNGPSIKNFRFQPLQEIAIGPWGGLEVTNTHVTLDSGPMLFGRSLRPTVMDVLSLSLCKEILPAPLTPSDTKLKETLTAMARSAKIDFDESLKQFEGLLTDAFCTMMNEVDSCLLVGPLAECFYRLLAPHDTNKKIRVHPLARHAISAALAIKGGVQ